MLATPVLHVLDSELSNAVVFADETLYVICMQHWPVPVQSELAEQYPFPAAVIVAVALDSVMQYIEKDVVELVQVRFCAANLNGVHVWNIVVHDVADDNFLCQSAQHPAWHEVSEVQVAELVVPPDVWRNLSSSPRKRSSVATVAATASEMKTRILKFILFLNINYKVVSRSYLNYISIHSFINFNLINL